MSVCGILLDFVDFSSISHLKIANKEENLRAHAEDVHSGDDRCGGKSDQPEDVDNQQNSGNESDDEGERQKSGEAYWNGICDTIFDSIAKNTLYGSK